MCVFTTLLHARLPTLPTLKPNFAFVNNALDGELR